MDKGYIFYADIIHPDVPLLPVTLLAIFNAFGFSVHVLQWFTWILIVSIDILVFSLSRKFFNLRLSYVLTLSI